MSYLQTDPATNPLKTVLYLKYFYVGQFAFFSVHL
jgi:hypothetical protein